MTDIQEILLSPREAFDDSLRNDAIRSQLKLSAEEDYKLLRRSIDARGKKVRVRLRLVVFSTGQEPDDSLAFPYRDVSSAPAAIVVGCGPAGMFAALRLIELGIKPIVLERGKDVRARRRDLASINKEHIVNADSNYCFGEGGAGTYSDGKLYTRSKKRGDIRRILEILVNHGATSDILVDAHPHIGTNKLPNVVTALRESILAHGGEVHFDTRVEDLILHGEEIKGVITQDGKEWTGLGVILATGHSARDIFTLLHTRGVYIESKPFALGVRAEHNQSLIDRAQYHQPERGPWLPAASYSLVNQVAWQGREKGVFSFCMCPGGFIVPAATAPGEIVVNGMSPSRRDSRYANSGIVVAIDPDELGAYARHGPLAGMIFQQEVEQRAWEAGGMTQVAPAQRIEDFVKGKVSSSLNETSYQPGLQSVDMLDVLPPMVGRRLQAGFRLFGRKIKGYMSNQGQIIGVESRTSSPVRIPRDSESLEHPQIAGLFPCGEGAGFAGGIVSAAMDGERCAEALAALRKK